MRHRNQTPTLDRRSGPRRRLLATLAANVILRDRVRTTVARAKAVRPLVERCITVGKRQTLVGRRWLLGTLPDPRATAKILEVLTPRYRERKGGYTRIVPIGRRRGDAAEVVLLELV